MNDAIDAIPNVAFGSPPFGRSRSEESENEHQHNEQRDALHHKVAALHDMMADGEVTEAIEELQNVIRPMFQTLLADIYPVTPLQIGKQEVLALVDVVIARMSHGGQ